MKAMQSMDKKQQIKRSLFKYSKLYCINSTFFQQTNIQSWKLSLKRRIRVRLQRRLLNYFLAETLKNLVITYVTLAYPILVKKLILKLVNAYYAVYDLSM